jgi:hypothetical protein
MADEQTYKVSDLDLLSWHGGCPVIQGEKWIGNFWVKFDDNDVIDKYISKKNNQTYEE